MCTSPALSHARACTNTDLPLRLRPQALGLDLSSLMNLKCEIGEYFFKEKLALSVLTPVAITLLITLVSRVSTLGRGASASASVLARAFRANTVIVFLVCE